MAYPAVAAQPSGAGLPDRPAVRPAVGSRAELRSRLTRLPDGHPSALFDDGGTARPLPTRLRQLELGLPAPGRDFGEPAARRPVPDPGVSTPQREPAPEPAAAPEPGPARELSGSGPAEVAAPVTPQPDPYERARAILAELESISAQSAPASPVPEPAAESGGRRFDLAQPDQPGPDHEQPGPDRDQQPGPDRAPQTGPDRAPQTGPLQRTGPVNGSGRRREPDDRAGLPPLPRRRGVNGHGGANSNGGANEDRGANGDGGASGNGNPAPRPDWQDPYASPAGGPASRADLPFPPWPPDQDANGGPAAPPRSRPPADAGLREIAAQVLAASQAAEGRTVFGSYGSSGLTPAILRIAAQLPVGGLAAGSEANTVKPADRFTAKLAKLAARNPGLPPAELARSIGDAVRYAFTFEPADYTEGTWLVHRKLKAQGFEPEARRNRWESPEYKGIFTRWRDPAHGQPFEVQFHTTASWIVAQRTHGSYAQITDPATAPDERARLRARQVAAAAEAKAPPACMEIADFRLEPR